MVRFLIAKQLEQALAAQEERFNEFSLIHVFAKGFAERLRRNKALLPAFGGLELYL